MKVEEDVLRAVLREAIADANNRPKTFTDKIKLTMHKMYNITGGEATDILNGKLPVELMQRDTLFKVTNVLYQLNKNIKSTFDADKLDLDIFFTENEKTEYNQKIDRKTQDEDIVIKAGNWMQVEDDQYVIKIYPDDLMETYINRNKINYNPETQRDLTIKETKTGKVKMITFFEKAYEEIIATMESNIYISDMLALNVNPDYFEPPRIVRDNLIIPKDSKIDCIDGYHRLKAAVTTKLRNPNWNKPLTFYLFVCDVNKAVRYILQEDKKNHLSEEQVTKVDATDASNFIIDKLNDSNSFYFRNTIDENKKIILNKIISKLFNPKKLYSPEDRQESVKLYKVIEENINKFVEQDNLFGIEVTKELWFIYLNVLKHCIDNNCNFVDFINKMNIQSLLDDIKFVNKPTDGHYKIIKEAISNV